MTPLTVLLIEDSEQDRYMLTRVLEAGIAPALQVLPTADAFEARALLDSKLASPPDVAVCDLRLPGMGGDEFIDSLRARPEFAHLPVILVTATGAEQRPTGLKADLIFSKPFNPWRLRESVVSLALRARNLESAEHQHTAPLLIVEDDAHLRAGLCDLFAMRGLVAHAVNDGLEAVRWLNTRTALPRVILTDLDMPRMDGRALLGSLNARREAGGEGPAVVVYSSSPLTGLPPVVTAAFQKFGGPAVREALVATVLSLGLPPPEPGATR